MKRRGPAPVTDLSEDEAEGSLLGSLLVGSRKTKRNWEAYAMQKSQQTPSCDAGRLKSASNVTDE